MHPLYYLGLRLDNGAVYYMIPPMNKRRKKKQRPTDPKLLKAYDEAWKALTSHPLHIKIEKLFDDLVQLQTWHFDRETFEEHAARYKDAKPDEMWAKIKALREQEHKLPESIRWFELYQKVNH